MSEPVAGRSLRERCGGVELLVVDVDGVLTAGGIVYGASAGEAGLEIKAFHVRDGSGLKLWHRTGKRSAIITGRSSPVVEARAAELGVSRVIQGAADKLAALTRLAGELKIDPSTICYVGDDVPDVPALRRVGLAAAVADGCAEARAAAHYVTRAPGGRGAVREVIELILRCQGRWDPR
jgi:3-deoxy-D-manno-octulosonate 8-phosphate phosphatase (KDO 8-P phosphatase)